MIETKCPYCPESFKNEQKYNAHLAIRHESNPDSSDIGEASIKSLIKTKERVEFILRKIPSTRNSDWLLYLYICRYWGQALVYNQEKKKIQFRDQEGITYEEFIHLPSWETIRRSRQSVVSKNKELEPTDQIIAARRAKQDKYHEYFKADRFEGYLGDTHIDFK